MQHRAISILLLESEGSLRSNGASFSPVVSPVHWRCLSKEWGEKFDFLDLSSCLLLLGLRSFLSLHPFYR